MKSLVLLVLAVLIGALSGCAVDKPLTMPEMPELPSLARVPSVADLPFVYKVDIQQGNVITQEMLAQLRIGMDKKKVNFVMGSPIIMDTFHGNRWDYLYTEQLKGGRPKRRRITLFFEDDLLARIEGDVVPAAGQIAVDTRQDMTVEVPKIEKKNVVTRIAEAVPFVGEDKPKPAKKSPTKAKEEPAPGAEKPVRAEPQLTPVQRAQLEEAAAPSVMGKLTDVLPFVDKPEHKPLGARPPAAAEEDEDEEDPDTELEEELEEDAEIEEDSEDEENDEDGMFQSLTDVLPFMDNERDEEIAKATEEADKAEARREEEKEAAEEEAVEEEATSEDELETEAPVADTDEEEEADDEAVEDEEEEEGFFDSLTGALPFMDDEDDSTDGASDEEEAASAVPVPVAVPTPRPLENQVPEEEEATEEETADDEPGLFDRWFGRD